MYKSRKCAYCGKLFIPTSPKQKYCKDTHYGKCPVCGKQVVVKDLKYGPRACSMECRKKEIEATSIEKYGTKNPNQNKEIRKKSKQTCLERYGTETPFGSKEVQEKIDKTNLERYGTIYPSETDEVKQKAKDTFEKKYGGKSPMSSSEVCEKQHKTVQEKYGVDNVFQNEEVKEKIKQTNLDKYGVENPQQNKEIKDKTKNTCLDRYGVESPFQNKEVQDKCKYTMNERYGVDYPLQSEEILNKTKQTNLARYGVESPSKNEEVKQRTIETNLKKYGTEYPMQTEDIYNKQKKTNLERYGVECTFSSKDIQEKIAKTIQERYGVPYPCMRKEAKNYKAISKVNKSFAELLDKNNINYEMEFSLGNYIYDFKVDKILVEINPTITHNSYMSIFDEDSTGRDKNYHLNKTNTAKAYGFQCVHIFDWDSLDKIIYMLLPKEQIYARKCEIREVSNKDCNEFLDKYHLQGTCKGQAVRLGLYYNDNLVQIMTFGKPRYNKNYQWELLRLCSDSKYAVVGGAERLFKHFVNSRHPVSIISYCDISKFSGDVYERLGMKLHHVSEPNKIWSLGDKRITDNLLRQRGYDQLFHTNYGKGTSNEELMLDNGWLPVYDCGQMIFDFYTNI